MLIIFLIACEHYFDSNDNKFWHEQQQTGRHVKLSKNTCLKGCTDKQVHWQVTVL